MGEKGKRRWAARYSVGLTAAITALTQACGGGVTHNPNGGDAGSSGHLAGTSTGGTSGSSDGNGGAASTISLGGLVETGGMTNPDCMDQPTRLEGQGLGQIGTQRTFYSWTTDEQVAELRAGGDLFSRSERPGLGRGLVFDELDEFAKQGLPESKLAELLSQSLFAKARFGWINAWATVLGMPGESYGNQLLEIELEPEAWIASFDGKSLAVYDAKGNPVPIDLALTTPERIGAIFHAAPKTDGAIYCGSFARSLSSFREFVLGNLQMVKQWSLATESIRTRLADDILTVTDLREALDCLTPPDPADWTHSVTCDWAGTPRETGTLRSYEDALSLVSELYYPSDANLASVMAALKMSIPTGAPLTVTPGK